MKIRNIAIAAAVIIASATPGVAMAQGTPVLDIKQLASMRQEFEQLRQQLAAAKQLGSQVTTMSTSIGQIGKGSLGTMLDSAGFSFKSITGGAKGILSNVEDMGSQAKSALTDAKKMAIAGENLNYKTGTDGELGLQDARNATKQLFFYNGSDAMDQTKISQLRSRRNSMLRETAVTAYAGSVATKASGTSSGTAADKLVAQVKDAPDLRGDVQANTGVLLAIYGEIVKQTALQADMVGVAAAQTLATDPTGKAN